ncbi:GNAT family N-acetyltransferase [Bacillus sp. RG28]|uniref:GNAT family N-acetyltransferase n=1 Tax=Gottfriedia endophytica TaxID=2820819 RepID=A0A940NH65_9BACI|nr:GNAT family N-acetyltransferase [Gottfriedia endophytica]MBP0725334.1 GNAT family N-acetyltransferase [Gottfriedia endophytica]
MKFQIHNNVSNLNLNDIKEVYHSVGWTKHTNEIIKQIFESSNVIAIVTVDDRVVGIGRAMSDGVFNAAIYDVVVHNDYQKQGIGKRIMEYLLEKLKNVSCIHLISTTGNEEFYRKFGLKKTKTGMARYLNPVLTEEYLD